MSRWHKTEWDMLPEHAFRPRPGGMTFEGGTSTPAPDPRLVEAQVRNLGVQDDMIRQIIQNTNDMAPVQKEQTQFALDTARQSWEQSQADREYAIGRRDQLTGLQDTMIQDAKTFNTEAKREELAGQAAADVSQAYTSAQRTQAAEMARMGVNPADGKYGSMSNALSATTALASASAKNGARTAARQEGQMLTDRASNALAGYPAMGMQTTAATAGYGGMGQSVANTGLAGLNSGYGQAAGMAGNAGNSAANMWGQQSNAYQQSQASSGATTGTLLGVGMSAAIAI
ncbi:hypothetical protein [Comamonas sp. B21-038]|uniref:hypothetical protein n=1 Tax=Comamonas sp. B21-038 TaxID=2918299 RepID=UPI001EFA79DA|nr:hypothetical protein [Comamonas sp. B21-038]ULR90905.1 hypothetical protein MJ205_08700 [Comamonas sp. B21-038]